MKRGVETAMNEVETLRDKVENWKKMAAGPEYIATRAGYRSRGREQFVSKSTAAAPTVSQHFIPLQQEVYSLRRELGEAASVLDSFLKSVAILKAFTETMKNDR